MGEKLSFITLDVEKLSFINPQYVGKSQEIKNLPPAADCVRRGN